MPKRCVVLNCPNATGEKKGETHFFKFPQLEVNIAKWIKVTGRSNWIPTEASVICNLHFKEEDYTTSETRKRLKADVIPTLGIHFMTDMQKKVDTSHKVCDIQKNTQTQFRTATDVEAVISCEQHLEVQENNVETELNSMTYWCADTDILTGTINELKSRKRTASDPQQKAQLKIEELEKENNRLRDKIQYWENKFEEEFEIRGNTLKSLFQQQQKESQEKLATKNKQLKVLRVQIKRKECKIKELLTKLLNMNLLSNTSYDTLLNEFENAKDLFINENKNKNKSPHGKRYSEEVKKFAVTLHYHSPKAYEFCRTVLTLPHPTAIRNWNSTVDASPGFQKQVLEGLKNLSAEDKDCNLIFDGMAIRQQVLWDQQNHRFVGFCDYGNNISLECNETTAKEALVFLLVSLNGKWKWPIAYFFKRSMTAIILKELITTALILTAEVQLNVLAIICDGETVNCSTLKEFGCNIFVDRFEDIQNSFPHPVLNYNVRILLDACHMLKLGRNTIAEYKVLCSKEGNIKWEHIEQLHRIQQQLTLKLKNKLSSQCVNWHQNKMKVKFAAHTLSASVANAMKYLKDANVEEFQDCESTVKFIETIDWLFDFLNSRNPFGKGFKQPLTRNRLQYVKPIIVEKINYLYELKIMDGRFLKHTGRKTFICGLALAVKSIIEIAEQIFNEKEWYKYLLTYRFSQDHLEILFAKIRSRHGHNNNPNVMQFKYAMRQILMRNSIKCSKSMNCIEMDNDPVGAVFDIVWKKNKENILSCVNIDESEDFEENLSTELLLPTNLQIINENILYYIAGYIIRKLKIIDCLTCYNSLLREQNNHCYNHYSPYSKFVDHVTRGGLLYASESVQKLVVATEKEIQILTCGFTNWSQNNLDLKILHAIRRKFVLDNTIFPNLPCDNVELLETPHKIRLINAVCHRYIKIRLYSYTKFYVQEVLQPQRKRHRLTKQILFCNE